QSNNSSPLQMAAPAQSDSNLATYGAFAMHYQKTTGNSWFSSGNGAIFPLNHTPACGQPHSSLPNFWTPSEAELFALSMASQMPWTSLPALFGMQQLTMPTQAHISSTNIFNEDGRQDEKKAKRMEKIEERMMRDNKEIEETEKWKQKATQLEEENKRLRNLLSSEQQPQSAPILKAVPKLSQRAELHKRPSPSIDASRSESEEPQSAQVLVLPSPSHDAKAAAENDVDQKMIGTVELQTPSIENGQFPSPALIKIFEHLPINSDGFRCPLPDTMRAICRHWNTVVRDYYRNNALDQRTSVRHLLISQMGDGFVTHSAMAMDVNLTPESTLSEIKWFGVEPNFDVKYAYHDSLLRNGSNPSELISPIGRRWISTAMVKLNDQLPSVGSPSESVRNEMFTYLKKFLSYYLPDEIILDEVDLTEAFVDQLFNILTINEVKGVKINFKSSGVYRRRGFRNVTNSCSQESLLKLMKISRHVEDIDQRLIDSTFIRKFVTGKKDNDFNVITVARHEVSG
ncbi:hypothetical protein PRIPAC_97866, partial [Pristionchus pacificus]